MKAFSAGLTAIVELLEKFVKLLGYFSAIILFVLFFWPQAYRCAVRNILPTAYYRLGSLGNPPKFDSGLGWAVDLDTFDNGLRAQRLEGLFLAPGHIARIAEGYIPGRAEAGAASEESAGRNWEPKQCLFINDIEFRIVVPIATCEGDPDARQSRCNNIEYIDSKQSSLNIKVSDFKRSKRTIQDYRELLVGEKLEDKCLKDEAGKMKCPRLQVWAKGTPAPCAIWPF